MNCQRYIVDADGANSRRLTSEPSVEDNPTWSRDGRFVYFRSDRIGRNHLWKAPAAGGAAVRVTEGEAWQGYESPDGRHLYFVRSTSEPGLWRKGLVERTETLALPGVFDGRWSVTSTGIVFVDRPETEEASLRLWPFDAPTDRLLVSLRGGTGLGFSASADARTALWTRYRFSDPDVVLVTDWKD